MEEKMVSNDFSYLKTIVRGSLALCLIIIFARFGLAANDIPSPRSNNADSNNSWEMSPEVEALFPRDVPFKEEAYQKYIASKKNSPYWNKRVHREFTMGTYKGVCLDYHINLELYGGEFAFGSLLPPPHPDHPRKDKFRYVNWVNLPPKENVPTIRSYYNLLGNSYNIPIHNYWHKISPLVKRLIENNKLLLQRAELDVNNDGKTESVYRVVYLDSSVIHRPDGKEGYASYLFMAEESDLAEAFNTFIRLHNEPFYYDDILYFTGPGYIFQGLQFKIAGKLIDQFVRRTICSLGGRK